MPRNASGVYSLPPTNPVVPSTTISTSWANPTLSDLASAVTDSLDRTGRGGMLAPFKIYDGNVNAPGLGFLNEPNLGIWRSGTGTMNFSAGSATPLQITSTQVTSLLKLTHYGEESYKAPGYKSWQQKNDNGVMKFVPSTSVNGEDWATAKTISLTDSGSGITLAGAPTPGSLQACTAAYAESVAQNQGVAGVSSFNSRSGAVSLTSGDVTTALTFTPANAAGQTFSGAVAATTLAAKSFAPTVNTANVTGTTTVSFDTSQSHILTLTGTASVSFTNIPVGAILRAVFKATDQGLTITGVTFPGGATPVYTTGAQKIALVAVENASGILLGSYSVY